ncbi:MAG: hypothetical protein ACOYZ6_00960 [Chloroflexota bacterium]
MKDSPFASRSVTILLVAAATVIGGVVRFAAPLASNFPLNDGGLFYVMIQALQASHYQLPAQFFYNGISIPFTYPPLGFYLTGFLSDLLDQNLLDVLRWLPPLVSAATIPAFYTLAKRVSRTHGIPILATFVFALLPRDFDWLIMGGGVTRAFGFLFAILTVACAWSLFSTSQRRFLFWASIWTALTVLTHPEAALQTVIAVLVMFLFQRSRANVVRALLVALTVILLTSPWWITSLTRHGVDPFLAAASASAGNRSDLVNVVTRFVLLFRFEFADEAFLPLLTVFGLIGFFAAIGRKDWFLPAWIIASQLIEPRSAPLFVCIPLAILSAQGLAEFVLPALDRTGAKRLSAVFLGLLLAYSIASALSVTSTVARDITVQPAEREAMQWVEQNTPPESVFLVLTNRLPLRDPISEWFPVLAGRVSPTTVYGYEWIAQPPFAFRVDAYNSLQACASQNVDCIDAWSAKYEVRFTHILFSNLQNKGLSASPLQIRLEQDPAYQLVYQTPEISIYQQR